MSTSTSTRAPALITTGLIVVSVIFLVLSLISISLRFWARRKANQLFRFDDWWVIAAWIAALGMSINAWVFSSITGINYYKISAALGTEKSVECIVISTCLLQVAITTVKISILLFYKRIFVTRNFRIAVWVAIGVVSCWGIIFFFLVLFQSDPVSASWTGEGRLVIDSTSMGLAQVGTSIALDVIILSFPLPMIFKLQLSMRRKIQLSLIFWLGAFCCAAAIARLVFYDEAIRQVQDSASYNQIYLLSNDLIFQILESNCSIIAACLPTLAPLLPRGHTMESFVQRVRSFTSLSSRKTSSSTDSSNTALNEKSTVSNVSSEPERRYDSVGHNDSTEDKEHQRDLSTVENGRISVTREVHS